MIIYTDYSIAIFIFKQIIFNIINIEKFNLRLICASQYFSIFNLEFRYKIDKFNIMFNILSCLLQVFIITTFLNQSEGIFDALYNNTNI